MTLRTKLLGGTLLLAFLIGWGAITALRLVLHGSLEAELQRRSISIARAVEDQVDGLLVTENFVELQLLLRSTQNRERNVAYLFIIDHEGEVVAHTFAEGFPVALRDANIPSGDGPVIAHFETELGSIYDIAMPIANGELGVVRLGMDGQELRGSVHRVLGNAGMIALLGVGIFAAAALVVEYSLVRRISEVTSGARSVSSGDLDCKISVRSRDELGQLAVAFNDMTVALRLAEERYVDLNSSLLHEVRERRRAEEELSRRLDELKALDRLKDGFVRDVSHELKTPVAKQAMQLESLRGIAGREGFLPHVERTIEVMERCVQRQKQVIHNLLTLSRLEAGARVYQSEPVALEELLREILVDYGPEIESHGIALTTELGAVTVASDREMLWHVFSNLLTNAIKFQKSPQEGAIDVRLSRQGNEAVVRIHNEGIGLAGADLEKVFERFFQARPSREGSGVGLTICRMIVQGVGGRVWFESAGLGTGATAVVTLPLSRVHAPGSPSAPEAPRSG